MRRLPRFSALFLIAAATIASLRAENKTVTFGRFGTVTIATPTTEAKHAVVLIAGDNGWTPRMDALAKEFTAMETLVIGVDGAHYLKAIRSRQEKCSYPAADFEELSQSLQKQLGLPVYLNPILIGLHSGGTLAYATLAQAPPTTFAGAISLGFCPSLPLDKPLCQGAGLEQEPMVNLRGYNFLPVKTLESPWVVLQGIADNVCSEQFIENFAKQVPRGDIVLLPSVKHDFADPALWLPQLKDVFARMASGVDPTPPSTDESTKGIPLVILPGKGPLKDVFAVLVSGDGGWAGIDRSVAKSLSDEGVNVVGLNSLRYFWKRRTPDEAARDLERIMRHFLTLWKTKSVILVGYSRGADVMPFMANRLPEDLLKKTSMIALMGLEKSIEFEIHAGAIFNMPGKHELPVRPEVDKLKGQKIVCFYGSDETDSLCHDLPPELAEVVVLKGGHHFGGDYKSIAHEILSRMK